MVLEWLRVQGRVDSLATIVLIFIACLTDSIKLVCTITVKYLTLY